MKISSGIKKDPHFILLFGPPGIGKTSFAAEAPNPISIDIEKGSGRVNTQRFEDINTYGDVLSALSYLKEQKHDFKTVVIDTLDALEPSLWDAVVKADGKAQNIEDVGGGFQKGYVEALKYWRGLISILQDLRQTKKMNIICLAHAQVRTTNDPQHPLAYDRFTLRLHENKQCSAAGLWISSVDTVLFAQHEDTIFKVNATDKKAKGSNQEGPRKIYTRRRPAFDAKNRLSLPPELPLSWQAFSDAADLGQPDSLENVNRDLKELSTELLKKDKVTAEKMIAAIVAAKDDVTKLISIRNHARVLCQ